MFDPKNNQDRINYGEALKPPFGYVLSNAIATTYSLDLETLTAIAISLGLDSEVDSEINSNPICMLNAMNKIVGKIIIFCDSSQIKKPSKNTELFLLLESMICPINLEKKNNRYPSFHPKMWVLEYENVKKEKIYRLVVMSRNLTFDHSWDIVCTMDGYIEDDGTYYCHPIISFLNFLNENVNIEKRKIINDLTEGIKKVKFNNGEKFNTINFLPIGIGKNSCHILDDVLFDNNEKLDRILIMSPFLSKDVIGDLNKKVKNKSYLITRKIELNKLEKEDVTNFKILVLNENVILGESAISENNSIYNEIMKQDIHAKIFITEKDNNVCLYLGSMNASYNAINSNVEFDLKLNCNKEKFGINSFLNEIKKDINPFEEIVDLPQKIDNSFDLSDNLNEILKEISRLNKKANVVKNGDLYDINVDISLNGNRYGNVTIKPLYQEKDKVLEDNIIFEKLNLIQLSNFYIITIKKEEETLSRIMVIPTNGIPIERNNQIIKKVVNTKKSFLDYISFILGDNVIQSYLDITRKNMNNDNIGSPIIETPIYEKMLNASIENIEKIKEIKKIVDSIDDNSIITDDFKKVYNAFIEALKLE